MESCGSTSSTFPVDLSLSLAIRVDEDKLEHKTPTASSHMPSSASKRVQEVSLPPMFNCKFCPRSFGTARALGGHQKAHNMLQRARRNSRKAHMSRRPDRYSVASALRNACLHARPSTHGTSTTTPPSRFPSHGKPGPALEILLPLNRHLRCWAMDTAGME
ncbi:uncharacterized protein [Aegilops tauschii subsp. strangulata]|uniref:uncharacterized protein n=1 Tax=Aegilops tauschii subsp. strangulata TaxID=200361 RepID=UPI001ABCA86C|nr:zinc finger protein 4-like [Aegilops tauschii subsp. strangulata]